MCQTIRFDSFLVIYLSAFFRKGLRDLENRAFLFRIHLSYTKISFVGNLVCLISSQWPNNDSVSFLFESDLRHFQSSGRGDEIFT